jgi:hypothetical protein
MALLIPVLGPKARQPHLYILKKILLYYGSSVVKRKDCDNTLLENIFK